MRPKKSSLGGPKKEVVILARPSKKFRDKFELLKNDMTFQLDINALRYKWCIDLKRPRLIVRDKDGLIPLLKKYKLSRDWEYIISTYIFSNEFEEFGDPHGLEIEVAKDKKSANIKIYPETTLREIRSAYSSIVKILKEGKIIKTTTATNFKRDSFIEKLYKERKSYHQISELVFSKFGGKKLDEFHLSKIVAKMKKRRKKII